MISVQADAAALYATLPERLCQCHLRCCLLADGILRTDDRWNSAAWHRYQKSQVPASREHIALSSIALSSSKIPDHSRCLQDVVACVEDSLGPDQGTYSTDCSVHPKLYCPAWHCHTGESGRHRQLRVPCYIAKTWRLCVRREESACGRLIYNSRSHVEVDLASALLCQVAATGGLCSKG